MQMLNLGVNSTTDNNDTKRFAKAIGDAIAKFWCERSINDVIRKDPTVHNTSILSMN